MGKWGILGQKTAVLVFFFLSVGLAKKHFLPQSEVGFFFVLGREMEILGRENGDICYFYFLGRKTAILEQKAEGFFLRAKMAILGRGQRRFRSKAMVFWGARRIFGWKRGDFGSRKGENLGGQK